MLKSRFSRGDTLIEVLFAVSVFSLVAVGTLSIMNQGTASSERSLETTLVRQQIDAQADTLRFLHDAYINAYQINANLAEDEDAPDASDDETSPLARWAALSEYISADPIEVADMSDGCATPADGSFAFDPKTTNFTADAEALIPAETTAKVSYDSDGVMSAQGLWIQATRHTADASTPDYIDFYIQACWEGPGLSVPMTLQTIVRLYEPNKDGA